MFWDKVDALMIQHPLHKQNRTRRCPLNSHNTCCFRVILSPRISYKMVWLEGPGRALIIHSKLREKLAQKLQKLESAGFSYLMLMRQGKIFVAIPEHIFCLLISASAWLVPPRKWGPFAHKIAPENIVTGQPQRHQISMPWRRMSSHALTIVPLLQMRRWAINLF